MSTNHEPVTVVSLQHLSSCDWSSVINPITAVACELICECNTDFFKFIILLAVLKIIFQLFFLCFSVLHYLNAW
jgi:hypothetical protein